MSDHSHIEWTQATWNPTTGCSRVSPGCDHCYIDRTPPFRMAHRRFSGPEVGATTGVLLHEDRLTLPLHWRKPRRIFVNSLSDLFHADVPDSFIARVFAVMAVASQHTFQLLTKRHGRMRSLLSSPAFCERAYEALGDLYGNPKSAAVDDWVYDICTEAKWPLPNVWLGVSVEDQHWADVRIPALLDTPAAVRWISAEPLLGPVDLLGDRERPGPAIVRTGVYSWTQFGTEYDYDDQIEIDWVVVGGESGPRARPMVPSWALSLLDQCQAAGVPFHFKQWGEYDERGRRVGKRAAGRLLAGHTHDGYPERAA
jgi:protein gp37